MNQASGTDDVSRVLITGSHGFVGRAVVSQIRARWPEAQLLTPGRDVLDSANEDQVMAFWQSEKPTALIHLAAFARGLGGNLSAGKQAFIHNEALIRCHLLAALHYGVRSVVFAGTVAEYAFPYRELPLREEDRLLGEPHSGEIYYALAKRSADNYLEALRAEWGTKVCHALLTNMYGPHDRFDPETGHVVAAMLVKLSRARSSGEKSAELWGRPQTTRDFQFVEDAADCLVQLLGKDCDAVNVASGNTLSMEEVADLIAHAVGYHGEISWNADRPIGIPERSVSVDKLRALVNIPNTTFEAGLAKTVEFEPWLTEGTGPRLIDS